MKYKFMHSQNNNVPEVFITLNKNRLKSYSNVVNGGQSFYLKNNDEFEIEFDNKTSNTWLARIKINGEWISESGLVLRPGEHVYLDTPDLDDYNKKKFRFLTYEIEKGREDLIKNNGLVEIFFYQKLIKISVKSPTIIIENYPIIIKKYPRIILDYRDDYTYYPIREYTTTKLPQYDGTSLTNHSNYSCNVKSDLISYSGNYSHDQKTHNNETGIIDKGSNSNSIFQEVNDNFESNHTKKVLFQLLPISKKPKTIQDIKEYCSGCGRRRRKNDHFCPSCGNKF